MPSQHTPPLLPPILPTERPSLFGGRIESTPSALSIPQRQLWTLPSRTPSYDSMNSETYDHDSAQRSDIEKVISQCHILCEDMDRYKSLIAANDTRVDQYELFDAMEKNARNLLRGLRSMRSSSSRPRYEWLDDSDRGSSKRSPDMDYDYDANRNDRHSQDSKSSLPVKQYRRRAKRATGSPRCHSCNTTDTPEWRRGPDGARTLCNACGLHYAKLMRKSEKKPA
ncbi:unnamed protein product [Umbelopsis ramanniana]